MDPVPKCLKCGLDLSDTHVKKCPLCGAAILPAAARMNMWTAALIHCALASTIMLTLRFPKPEIVLLGILIFAGTVYSRLAQKKTDSTQSTPQQITRPAFFIVLNLLIAIGMMALFATLLFGSLSFRYSWDRWHQYQGHSFHRADFEVQQVYHEKRPLRFGDAYYGVDRGRSYAFGLVEGSHERIDVADYLQYSPRSQAELDRLLPPGTRIPVYFFPDMNGSDRVRVYEELTPAEASQRMAMKVLKNGLLTLAGTGMLVFVLIRLTRRCFDRKE